MGALSCSPPGLSIPWYTVPYLHAAQPKEPGTSLRGIKTGRRQAHRANKQRAFQAHYYTTRLPLDARIEPPPPPPPMSTPSPPPAHL